MSLCNPAGRAVILLAISAYNTDVRIENGLLRLPPVQGSQFKSFAVPRSVTSLIPTPEDVAALAFRATGQRVTEVPQLELPPYGIFPSAARWRIELERPVAVTVTGQSRMERTFFVGRDRPTNEPSLRAAGLALPTLAVRTPRAGATMSGVVPRGPIVTFSVEPRPGKAAWLNVQLDGR